MNEILTIASVKAGDKWMDFTFKELNEKGEPKTYCCKYHVASNAKEKADLAEEILNTGYIGKRIRIIDSEHEFEFVVSRFHLLNSQKVYEAIRREEDWSDETEQKLFELIKSYAKVCHEDFCERLMEKKIRFNINNAEFIMATEDIDAILKDTPFQTP